MQRISFNVLQAKLAGILQQLGFTPERAQVCSRLFAETTCDGVYTHGVSRFPRFVATIQNGSVDPAAEPELVTRFRAVERWNGRKGPGNLNAHACMARAMTLAQEHGIGCVSLANTNHWMRGGTYGWQAAETGLIGICWTNTMPNLPAWGAAEACIGNNPLVIAVPRSSGPVVLDMAMSQFSYGALEKFRSRGELLPVDGGFDADGNLTRDPAAIEASQRPLPAGYWKGSGLAMVLDMIAAMTALGKATCQISNEPLRESGLSQVFVAIQPKAFGPAAEQARLADAIIASVQQSRLAQPGTRVRFPGEETLRTRAENLALGVPVDEALWAQILAM